MVCYGMLGQAASGACSQRSACAGAAVASYGNAGKLYGLPAPGPAPLVASTTSAAPRICAGPAVACYDDASPLSSDSRFVYQQTPAGAEVGSVGSKRTFDQLAGHPHSLALLQQQQHQSVAEQTLLVLRQRQALPQQQRQGQDRLAQVPAVHQLLQHEQYCQQQQQAHALWQQQSSASGRASSSGGGSQVDAQLMQALLVQRQQTQQQQSQLSSYYVMKAASIRWVVMGCPQQVTHQASATNRNEQLLQLQQQLEQQQQQLVRQQQLAHQQQQQQQQQQLAQQLEYQQLAPQGSSGSFTSSSSECFLVQQPQQQCSAGPVSNNSYDAISAWQQLVQQQQRQQHQEQQHQEQQQQQHRLLQVVSGLRGSFTQQPLLDSVSSVTSCASSSSALSNALSLLQQQQAQQRRQQQQQQPVQHGHLQPHLQPPTKRAATHTAVAALLNASALSDPTQFQFKLQQLQQRHQQQVQQHQHQLQRHQQAQELCAKQGLLLPRNSSTSSTSSSRGLSFGTAESALAAAAAVVASRRCRVVPDSTQCRLLVWAGQVLSCELQDAYHLASHIFDRVAGRLDDMLLISLGIAAPIDSVTMLICMWVASKLECHRRQVAGCSRLAAALQLPSSSVTSVELHLMQLLNWQPYAGWEMRLPGAHPNSCVVTEY